jgi:hypothetical protein
MITPLGTQTVGTFAPGVSGGVGTLLADVQGKLTGALAAQVSITASPPTFASQLDAALDAVASITAAIVAGAPELSFQATAIADLIAELQASVTLLGELNSQLVVAGLTGYVYQGPASGLATELGGETNGGVAGGGPNDQVTALVLAASEPGVIAAMSAVFGAP